MQFYRKSFGSILPMFSTLDQLMSPSCACTTARGVVSSARGGGSGKSFSCKLTRHLTVTCNDETKCVPSPWHIKKRACSSSKSFVSTNFQGKQKDLFFFSKADSCTDDKFQKFESLVTEDALVVENFITEDDESRITKEVQKSLARLKYQYDHWDGVIYGYREIEKSRWTPESTEILEKIKSFAFDENAIMLPAVHVLDLAKEGYIKPHVDSKFCGSRIAGLSLLSTSVMRLKYKDDDEVQVDILLRPRTLYLMRGRVRYELTHEILSEKDSNWNNEIIPRERRISVMLREEPSVN